MIYVLALVAAAVAALLVISGIWWAIPILVIGVVMYAMRERREGASVSTSSGSPTGPEPDGLPRSNSGGAETANERVGQS